MQCLWGILVCARAHVCLTLTCAEPCISATLFCSRDMSKFRSTLLVESALCRVWWFLSITDTQRLQLCCWFNKSWGNCGNNADKYWSGLVRSKMSYKFYYISAIPFLSDKKDIVTTGCKDEDEYDFYDVGMVVISLYIKKISILYPPSLIFVDFAIIPFDYDHILLTNFSHEWSDPL